MRSVCLTVVLYCFVHAVYAQTDSIGGARSMEQVVVTASRTAGMQDSLPVPITVITQKYI